MSESLLFLIFTVNIVDESKQRHQFGFRGPWFSIGKVRLDGFKVGSYFIEPFLGCQRLFGRSDWNLRIPFCCLCFACFFFHWLWICLFLRLALFLEALENIPEEIQRTASRLMR